ncbi:Cullin-domain-containing protein [Lentinula aff. detonsa]|uniref:Cullin-domain-containing protein n=1 Tax=Lentinula aff. detonsa TaxID=2804958 RepID=A0AA38KQV0_9AGAR|nr:Cullin-domain-containing protein [Lentinula aff. detonsa]
MAAAPRRGIKPKIKPPKKHGPDVSVEETWSTLSQNIKEILNHNAANLSFEENHRYAYNLVLYNNGEILYRGMKRIVAENLDKLAKEQIVSAFPTTSTSDLMQRSQENELLLKALKNVWDDHTSNMTKLGQILKYMDRIYTQKAAVPKTWEAGLELFLKHILCFPIKDHLLTAILNQIQYEREGYTINRSAVKGCIDVLLSLDAGDNNRTVYQQDLEPMLLRESEAFYKTYGDTLLESCDTPEYLSKVESRFESEESRTHLYLSRKSAEPLLRILQDHLLTDHLDAVIAMPNSGLDTLFDLDKYEDLARLYRLFLMVPDGIPCLKKNLKASIARRGRDINQASTGLDAGVGGNEAKDNDTETRRAQVKGKGRAIASQTLTTALKWVQDALDLKDKVDSVWMKSFDSDTKIQATMIEAFETFINSNDKCSEFISLFIDDHLKRGLKGKTDAEVDVVLEKSITIFRYLTEKDVFERYYKNHLAKRLLHARSVSDDAERGMLAKLKIECGYQFTQKLEGMFHDIKISTDNMQSYREHLAKSSMSPKIDISVIVMTSTFWPTSHSSSPCNLPQQLLDTVKPFERFYYSRHSGRRLSWQLSLGNVDVRVAFKSKQHDLNVATFAVVILLLFEDLKDDDFLTYEEIQQATSLEHADLQRQLQSLACAKYKVLKKHPPGRDVQTSDSFSFNSDFAAPLQKIKISTVSSKVESGEELKETRDRIDEERRHQTEACIVRIMKDRKHMSHNDLINEVTRLLASRFQPNPLIIKKRIEGLIERDYLERGEDRKSYKYLA